ncbi:MAG: ABC transporter substrate-binding protein [Brevinema sp.]
MLKKLLLLGMILWLGACQSNENPELVIAAPVEPSDIKPYTINEGHAYKVRWQIFDRLITADSKGNLIPGIATGWELIDPTTIELTIRQGVVFHNGDLLTMEDIKYSIDTAISVSTLQSTLGVFKASEIVDNQTIRVFLHEPNASAFALFSASGFLISSKKSMTESTDPNTVYNGTGPFKFVEWNRGQNIILERHDQYWGTPAYVQKVNYRIIPEASVRMIAVETGEVDIAYDIDGADREQAINNPNVNYIEEKGSRMDYLGMTMTKAPFNNPKVREAIAWALDIEGMISSVMFGSAEYADSAINDTILYYYDGIPKRTKDLQKARALLSEAGILRGQKIDLWTMDGFRRKLAEIVQANLSELGFEVNIIVYEWATYVEGLSRGDAPMFFLGWTTNPLDADAGLYSILHSSSRGAGGNYLMYSHPLLDEYLDIGRNVSDPEIRREVYQWAQQHIYDEAPLVPLFYFYNNVATSKQITQFVLDPFSYHELKHVIKK